MCPSCGYLEKIDNRDEFLKSFTFKKRCIVEDTNLQNSQINSLQPIIIPPTYYKNMSNKYIQQIFWKADTLFRQAKSITFCGYSFPDADMHVKYLLKRIELYNQKTPDIHILNFRNKNWREEIQKESYKLKEKEKNILKKEIQKSDEKERYKRFFSEKNRVYYYEGSFQDFCSNGTEGLKEFKIS